MSFGTLNWYLLEVIRSSMVLSIFIYSWITPIFSPWGSSHVVGLQIKGLPLLCYQIAAGLEMQPLLSSQEFENNVYMSGGIDIQISFHLTPGFILKDRKREKRKPEWSEFKLYSGSLQSTTLFLLLENIRMLYSYSFHSCVSAAQITATPRIFFLAELGCLLC